MKLIARGAEADILLNDNKKLTKFRKPKLYRLACIDEKLRKRRTKSEFNILKKLAGELNVPEVENLQEASFDMQHIKGTRIREELNLDSAEKLCTEMGRLVGMLHARGIIHGDLTTSNFLLEDKELYIIDFGLSYYSVNDEDRAVDIHLMYQSLNSSHYEIADLGFKYFKKGYLKEFADSKAVMLRFNMVEARGRNKKK
jgi:TP53 regulating kinase and related kinases